MKEVGRSKLSGSLCMTRSHLFFALCFPNESQQNVKASKYYEDMRIWFFTINSNFLTGDSEYLRLLLAEEKSRGFQFIKIPREYLVSNRTNLSERQTKDKIDFHISAKRGKKYKDIRGAGLEFKQFRQYRAGSAPR